MRKTVQNRSKKPGGLKSVRSPRITVLAVERSETPLTPFFSMKAFLIPLSGIFSEMGPTFIITRDRVKIDFEALKCAKLFKIGQKSPVV